MSEAVKSMFDQIAGKYDFLNHFLSVGRDLAWRKKAIRKLKLQKREQSEIPLKVLDLCGGTGDFLKALQTQFSNLELSALGDFSFGMLQHSKGKFEVNPCLQLDALEPPFRDETFDLVLCGYGMRNLDSLEKGMKEIYKLLTPGGVFITLEFFRPTSWFPKFFYGILSPIFIPILGGFFSGRQSAYEYLITSVKKFISVTEYMNMAKGIAYKNVRQYPCDGGISHIVFAEK